MKILIFAILALCSSANAQDSGDTLKALQEIAANQNSLLRKIEEQASTLSKINERQQVDHNLLGAVETQQRKDHATLEDLRTQTQTGHSNLKTISSHLENLNKGGSSGNQGTDSVVLEKLSHTLETVTNSQKSLKDLSNKHSSNEKILGSISSTLNNLPTSQAQSVQQVADLKKAAEAYATELKSLRETQSQLSQKLSESLTSTNTASTKQISALEKEVAALKKTLTALNKDVAKALENSQTPLLERLADSQNKILQTIQESSVLNKLQRTYDQGVKSASNLYNQGAKDATATFLNVKKHMESGKLQQQVVEQLNTNIYAPLRPIFKKQKIPEQYHDYILFWIVAVLTLFAAVFSFYLVRLLLCKPIGWLCSCCCGRRSEKEEIVEEEIIVKVNDKGRGKRNLNSDLRSASDSVTTR